MKIFIPSGSDFPIENLPYGVFSSGGGEPHIGVAIGEQIFDLKAATLAGLFDVQFTNRRPLCATTLNPLLALGRATWTTLRERITDLLAAGND